VHRVNVLHHFLIIAVHGTDCQGTGARQLARFSQRLVPPGGADIKLLTDLVGDTFKFMHGSFSVYIFYCLSNEPVDFYMDVKIENQILIKSCGG